MGWRPFNYAGNSLDGTGDLYNYQPENYIFTPQKRYTTFLGGTHRLSDRLRPFFEVVYTNRQSEQKLAPTPLFTIEEGTPVSAGNRYNDFGAGLPGRAAALRGGRQPRLQPGPQHFSSRTGPQEPPGKLRLGRLLCLRAHIRNHGQPGQVHPEQPHQGAGAGRGMHGKLRPPRYLARRRDHHAGDAGLHPVYRRRPGLHAAEDPAVEPDGRPGGTHARTAFRGRGRVLAVGVRRLYARPRNGFGQHHGVSNRSDRGKLLGPRPVRRDPAAGLPRERHGVPPERGGTGVSLRYLRRRADL